MTNELSLPHRRSLLIARLLYAAGMGLVACGALAATLPVRQRAEAAYHRAEQLRVALESHSQPALAGYVKVIRAFELVYRIDPGYPETPAALAAAAEVYQEIGRRFANDRYYSQAIESYCFLIAQYPHASLSRDALFTVAQIYRTGIENPEAARTAYRDYLQKYPYAEKATLARQNIASIDRQLAQSPAGRSASAIRPAVAHYNGASQSPIHTSDYELPAGPGDLQEVEGIRQWVGADYTRVVIRMGGQVKFNAIHLMNPPRLVFDLSNTQVSPDLAKKVFPVESGFLQRVRIAQFKPTVTRVVLDVPEIEDYSVFSLPNPFRLVIDIHGSPAPMVRDTSRLPSVAHNSTARSQSTKGGRSGLRRSAVAENPPLSQGPAEQSLDGYSPAAGMAGSQGLSSGAASDFPVPSPTLTRALGLKIRRIVIDPGHGGHDTGTIGPGGLEEKNVVLDVALRLRKLILQRMGCQAVMTRSSDTFIPLEERTAIANAVGADLFISIHANSSPDASARGIETYYLNFTSDPEALALAARENATSRESVYQLQNLIKKIALSEKIGESQKFAAIVDHQLAGHLAQDGDPQPDRGVKKAPFVVLIGANMPSILAEISFLSNPHDARRLRKAAYREQIAKSLYDGIARYVESLGTIRLAQRQASRD